MHPFKLYYFSDKACKLINRRTGSEKDFVIEAPNGAGIYEVDINELYESKYIDGNGILRNGYNEYEVILTFGYKNHNMDLNKLMDADEILIPWSFDLKDEREDLFVLDNEEMIHNFFADLPLTSSNREIPKGDLNIVFRSVNPVKKNDIVKYKIYREPIPAPSQLFISILPDGIDVFARISWESVFGADGYNLYLKSNGEFVKINTELIPDTEGTISYDTSSLAEGNYEVYATSSKEGDEGPTGDIVTFDITWVLEGGKWNDDGIWLDARQWQDTDEEPDTGIPPEGIIFAMTSRSTLLRSLDYNLDIIHSQSVISGNPTAVEAMGTRPDLKVAFNTTQTARYLYQYNKDEELFSLLFTNSTPFARAHGLDFSSMDLNRWFHGLATTSNPTHGSMWNVDPPGLFVNIIPSTQPTGLHHNSFTYAAIANGNIPYLAQMVSFNSTSYLTRRSIDDLSAEWVVDLPYGFISKPSGVPSVSCIGLRDGGVIVIGATPSTVVKYNSEGDLIWSFNTELSRNSCLAIERDNSFYVGAATSRVVRKYSAGSSSSDPDLIWEISLGSDGFLNFYPVALASDGAGKLIISGSLGSLVLVDSINGDLINQRTIGGSNENVLQAIAIHPGNLAIF